jgi:hypothetical protein
VPEIGGIVESMPVADLDRGNPNCHENPRYGPAPSVKRSIFASQHARREVDAALHAIDYNAGTA